MYMGIGQCHDELVLNSVGWVWVSVPQGCRLKQQCRSAYIVVSEVVSWVLKNNFEVCHAIVVECTYRFPNDQCWAAMENLWVLKVN